MMFAELDGPTLFLQVFTDHVDTKRKSVTIEVSKNEIVSVVKQKVLDEVNDQDTMILVQAEQFSLSYNGTEMDNNSTLSDYGISDWEVLEFGALRKSTQTQTRKIIHDDVSLCWFPNIFQAIFQLLCITDDAFEEPLPYLTKNNRAICR